MITAQLARENESLTKKTQLLDAGFLSDAGDWHFAGSGEGADQFRRLDGCAHDYRQGLKCSKHSRDCRR
jgi:hypothetical protein